MSTAYDRLVEDWGEDIARLSTACEQTHDHPSQSQSRRACIMRAMRTEGWTYARIGRAFGLTASRISQIVRAEVER